MINRPTILTEIVQPKEIPVINSHFHHFLENGLDLWLWNITKLKNDATVKKSSMESKRMNLPKVLYEFSNKTNTVISQTVGKENPIALAVK